MEQFRQVGEALGSLKALMVFKDENRINSRQCSFLVELLALGFQEIAEEMSHNLKFEDRLKKWNALEQPLKELRRIFSEAEQYVRQCLETKDWWAKVISMAQNTDCVELHLHNLFWCISVVIEAIEIAGEISGCDQEIQEKRLMFSKKYEKEWMDPKLFQCKFGKQYLVSKDLCTRIDTVWKEDRWMLLEMIGEKKSLGSAFLSKQEHRIAELLSKNLDGLEPSKGKLFPSSVLVGTPDYKVKRRLGNGTQYREIQWMGESFAVRHFLGEIEPLVPEISRLSSLSHPNVMHFLCGFSDEEKKECFLVMELMNKDLCSFIKEICSPRRRIPFSLPVVVDIMLQIARGMVYLHSRRIYHGDLTTSNILVKSRNASSDDYLHVKVGGFGCLSGKNFIQRTSSNQADMDPSIWYAPEVLLEQEQPGNPCNSKYTEKADVYSFGMMCFELLTGKIPFDEGHLQGDSMSRNIKAGERPLFPFQTPKYLTNLTKRCWQTDPVQRPSFPSICRILRYIKRFLVLNPDHSQPDTPVPLIDYFDLEANLSKKFPKWVETLPSVSQIPFEMFAYRVCEKKKTTVNLKENSDSGSDATSGCGDENLVITDEQFPVPPRSTSPNMMELNKKIPMKKSANAKTSRNSGQKQNRRALRPPQMTPSGRSLRTNSEHQLPTPAPASKRKPAGHASDSEIP